MAYERLIWGFWDREAGNKQRRNWRSFMRAYNRIRRFDYVLIQIAKTGEIHAMARAPCYKIQVGGEEHQ